MTDDDLLARADWLLNTTVQERMDADVVWQDVITDLAAALRETRDENAKLRGKADWIYEPDLDIHIPSCSRPKGYWRCGNGPLIGDAIITGSCGFSHESVSDTPTETNQ